MYKILLCGFLIILCCPLYAQQKLIRELQQKLASHPQPDTFRVNRLLELSELRDLPLSQRDTFAGQALAMAQKLDYTKGKGFALLSKARARFDSGDKPGMIDLIEQVKKLIAITKDQRLQIKCFLLRSRALNGTPDSKKQIIYLMQAYQIAKNYPDKDLLVDVTRLISDYYTISLSDFVRGLEWALKAEKIAEGHEKRLNMLNLYSSLANVYNYTGENDKARSYYKRALKLNEEFQLYQLQAILLNNMAEIDRLAGNYKEANKAYFESFKYTNDPDFLGTAYGNIADVYGRAGNYPEALKWAFKALEKTKKTGDDDMSSSIYATLARVYLNKHMPDSALFYGTKGYALSTVVGNLEYLRDNALALSDSYANTKAFEKAYQYHKLYIAYRDSMLSTQITNKTGLLVYKYDLSKKEAQITKLNEEKKLQRYLLFAALAVLCSIALSALLLVRANRQKQKAFNLLSQQKQLIQDQRDETEQALAELKRTQDQLIRSEKMASLGELTAGIAHEIQNPLNFVNNFSGVSMELVDEMEAEIAKGDLNELAELARTVKQNLGMIEQHGKRADNIVKGMLQHSRKGSSTKEPTDINKLADEYLRLAYHGLKAKDKTFNAELVTNFGADLPKINTVPQDLGRVLLNLFNNAFYAVQQQKKLSTTDHLPTVELSTAVVDNQITIKVRDNGAGIPDTIKDKIMQPFFTTKPTGEGTGLGLSLSYDIIVKGHGGTIDVKSEPGKFTEFIISLPVA